MSTYQSNRNLTIHSKGVFNGREVLTNHQLSQEYLASIEGVLTKSLQEYPRTFVVRVDLHLPSVMACREYPGAFNCEVITRFLESLKSQCKAHQERSRREGKRVHRNTLRYIWVKEQGDSDVPHYHLALLFNNDAYFTLGDYKSIKENLAGRIYKAWARALMVDTDKVIGLVHFPIRRPTYHLNFNSNSFQQDYNEVFKRLSYLAKFNTKNYGIRKKNFSASWR